jgi:hypothetical protein
MLVKGLMGGIRMHVWDGINPQQRDWWMRSRSAEDLCTITRKARYPCFYAVVDASIAGRAKWSIRHQDHTLKANPLNTELVRDQYLQSAIRPQNHLKIQRQLSGSEDKPSSKHEK